MFNHRLSNVVFGLLVLLLSIAAFVAPPFSGLDTRSTELVMGLLDDLAAEGRTLLVATHDVDQARVWDLVLCLNGVQVAFGPPEETLTLPTLERTYGGAIVELPGDHGHGVLPPHHHEH